MRKIIIVAALSLGLAGCAGSVSIPNPVSQTNLYQAELVFDGSLKTFNELKSLCAVRVLPPVCRTYVLKGQDLIRKAYAADRAARTFVDNNPTIDPGSVIAAYNSIVSAFAGVTTDFGALK